MPSSTELSEAINSIFQWYEKSAICYVYLQDIGFQAGSAGGKSILLPNLKVGKSNGSWTMIQRNEVKIQEEELARANWFTRGWTSQVLIAPTHLTFSNQDWVRCGAKLSLISLIGRRTGILEEVLHGDVSLETISIAERTTWSAGRHTAKVEDIAYCLFGIFNVNMPLLYGEDPKAFLLL